MEHHSWKNFRDYNLYLLIDNDIPEYNIDEVCYEKMYDNFYDKYGCIIIRNAFDLKTMNEYENWCNDIKDVIKDDKNINHPIQKDKVLYNKTKLYMILKQKKNLIKNLI